jgi:hypothetical protein
MHLAQIDMIWWIIKLNILDFNILWSPNKYKTNDL